eukprot:CAMPEP_0196585522 /NCGR_PEP_ID=MMETSP1081-20130531/50988_1 /TAXON_ID=36882 /ORGANISM="Pyramimonas amylifera, Strain CCMP720" /LENGTH=147 /DNA_ID=CAMNT_0041907097 /DNA_START=147 /DNA_END=590 /DNA_ORIENTATION=-
MASPYACRWICDRAFEKIDQDHNSKLDRFELQLAVYEVYNLLNKRFPGWSDPPSRDVVLEGLKKFDKDGDMNLNKEEFFNFMCEFLVEGSNFFKRVSGDVAKNSAIVPAVTPFVKRALGMGEVPDKVLGPMIGSVTNMAVVAMPKGL